jgi:hypothetical protein
MQLHSTVYIYTNRIASMSDDYLIMEMCESQSSTVGESMSDNI